MRGLSSGNACYYLVQSVLSSRLLQKKYKNENIQDYNIACDFVLVRNLVSDTKGGT
jgi:hypothetical protein